MIGLGARFADYGLTGGFFMFSQVAALAWFFPKSAMAQFTAVSEFVSTRLAALPEPAHPAFSSLMVALAVLSIFFLGLLLELIGSLFIVWEAKTFKAHLDRNEEWFQHFVQEHGAYSKSDYERFMGGVVSMRESVRRTFAILRFWNHDERQVTYRELARSLRIFGTWGSFRRLESWLMAYILAASGASNAWLSDQLRLCRTSRAIAVTLLVLALEVLLLTDEITDTLPRVVMTIPVAALGLSLFITFRSYSRFCITLFSLTYAHKSLEAPAAS